MVKTNINKVLLELVQSSLDTMVQELSVPFRYRVGTIKSEDGYFKVYVLPSTPKTKLETSRLIFSLVTQRIEDDFQGLRLMLIPAEDKPAPHRKRRAA